MPGRTINLREVPEDLYRGLKIRAAVEGITLKALVEKACREYLARPRKAKAGARRKAKKGSK